MRHLQFLLDEVDLSELGIRTPQALRIRPILQRELEDRLRSSPVPMPTQSTHVSRLQVACPKLGREMSDRQAAAFIAEAIERGIRRALGGGVS